MMLNKPVAIGGDNGVALAMNVDEQRVRLHRKLKRIARARGYLDLQEAEALREAQKVQLWKEFGHTSLVDYMVNELGYTSHHTAEERLRLANALPQLPKLTEAIQTGQINMSQARELSRVVTPETEEKWIEKALDLNVRQVEKAVTGHVKGDLPEDPIDHRLIRKTLYLSVRPETEILFREARKALEAERGERLDEDAVLEAMCRLVLRVARLGDDKAVSSSSHVGATGDDARSQVAAANTSSHGGAIASANTCSHGGATNAANTHVRAIDAANASSHVGAIDAANASSHGGAIASANSSSHAGAVDAANTSSHGEAISHGGAIASANSSSHAGAVDAASTSSHVGAIDAGNTSSHVGEIALAASTDGVAGAAYRVAVTVCERCRRGWQHGAGAVVELSPAAIERATCDAQWIGNLNSTVVERARQEISPATRRKVLHRDQNRCRVPGCQSHTNLDIHHIVHRAHGGTNELSNLITLCEAHHLAHHDGTLHIVRNGDELNFKRQASNRFTRKTREVATRKELRRRGFSRDVIAEIMTRTINIVGETDLTDEQWLTIALRTASEHAS